MQNPIGTGPFRFKEWKRGSHITLERNQAYWKNDRPYLDQVICRVIPDGAARAIALETGEIDLAPMNAVPQADIAASRAARPFEVSNEGAEGLGPLLWIEVNLREKPLAMCGSGTRSAWRSTARRSWTSFGTGRASPPPGPSSSANPVLQQVAAALSSTDRQGEQAARRSGLSARRRRHALQAKQYFTPYGENLRAAGRVHQSRSCVRSASRSRHRAPISAAG